MKKNLIASILIVNICMTSLASDVIFASERYSAYEDNIDFSKYENITSRLQKITKDGQQQSIAAQYKYNDSGKIIFRDYAEGTIEYKYDSNGKVVKVLNKLKKDNINNPAIIHVKENSISEYTYDSEGKISKEIKKVFDVSDTDLSGEPSKVYKIDYYYDGEQLSRKSYTPRIDSDEKKEYTLYSYDKNGRVSKIIEKKNGTEYSMTLEYDEDGDITKAIQNKNGIEITREISYVENSIYPIYFVDPVKEKKIDLDFFASSYKLIDEMKITSVNTNMTFKYDYKFNEENIPTESELTSIINGNEFKTKYLLEY
ncbi:sugar-binding protein [Clostridium perfringens]|uniref:Uncharacterized protein n=1 Tax=Clostridium perfringens TaxID=1502 RepID=A0A4Y5T5H1_CLOPF|nr:sugar-binding protein [Clostridium perfringens]MBO3326789.1 sugar-binding protein [Clostridium perfringens]MDM0935998.1 sugar-binding protein [Clostridium perfringens]PWX37381.1 sugar-binding protein [Clostridium perfringens]PWX53019.1 sugar-binding protein [Clostridium perfringens]QDB01180.1 hypothetical protein [Clostridium perfringens]